MTNEYSSAQKCSLAGAVIGALMCAAGAVAPHWLVSDPQGFWWVGQLVGKYVKGHLGLWMFCLHLFGGTKCEAFDMRNDTDWFHACHVSAVCCVLLGVLSGLISLCAACSTYHEIINIVGYLAFLAAVAGATSVTLFVDNMEVFTSSILDFKLVSFGWAFYLFCAGVGLLGVVSYTVLWHSSSEDSSRNMNLGRAAATTAVSGDHVQLAAPTTVSPHTTCSSPVTFCRGKAGSTQSTRPAFVTPTSGVPTCRQWCTESCGRMRDNPNSGCHGVPPACCRRRQEARE